MQSVARAQLLDADDFFNDGAHLYLSNNIPQALQSVEDGLQHYPDDEKLKKLEELLKQQQKQQQQQQKQQQQNSQSQSQNNSSSQPQKPDNSGQQQSQSQPQPQSGTPDQSGQKQPDQKNGQTQNQPQTVGPDQMTPAEATNLLNQQKSDEQVLVMKPRVKPPDSSHP